MTMIKKKTLLARILILEADVRKLQRVNAVPRKTNVKRRKKSATPHPDTKVGQVFLLLDKDKVTTSRELADATGIEIDDVASILCVLEGRNLAVRTGVTKGVNGSLYAWKKA